MLAYFFFYGTLIPEFAPPHLRDTLAAFQLVGQGWTHGSLYNLGSYPGAVLNEASASRIYGRVYSAPDDDQLIAPLDRYEGYDSASPSTSEYIRKRCAVKLDNGETVDCWVYEYQRLDATTPRISNGRWEGGSR